MMKKMKLLSASESKEVQLLKEIRDGINKISK